MFRYPRYRFRPGHCDALHVDLWRNGENLLRDGGSFSYNIDADSQTAFAGTAGHNTIQFDNREQMPKVGRFLRGAWLQAQDVSPPEQNGKTFTVCAGYRDWLHAYHHRTVQLCPQRLIVTDNISDFAECAVLRWRLKPGNWQLQESTVSCDDISLEITSDIPIANIELDKGWESRYYMHKQTIPVLEITVTQPGRIETKMTF